MTLYADIYRIILDIIARPLFDDRPALSTEAILTSCSYYTTLNEYSQKRKQIWASLGPWRQTCLMFAAMARDYCVAAKRRGFAYRSMSARYVKLLHFDGAIFRIVKKHAFIYTFIEMLKDRSIFRFTIYENGYVESHSEPDDIQPCVREDITICMNDPKNEFYKRQENYQTRIAKISRAMRRVLKVVDLEAAETSEFCKHLAWIESLLA
jgi:hypothetical protein